MIDDNSRIEEYKTLVLMREKLRKEAHAFWMEYIKRFGELLEELYTLQLDCIKLKKSIAFCQERKNRGMTLLRSELDEYIDNVIKDYREELDQIIQVRNTLTTQIAEIDYYKIKKLYRKLAIMLHPDLHPLLFEHEEIVELWERLQSAYVCNNYTELLDLEVLITVAVSKYDDVDNEIRVDNIDSKILMIESEIYEIIHTDPYKYKELLQDEGAIADREDELREDIEEYSAYLVELQGELSKFDIGEFA